MTALPARVFATGWRTGFLLAAWAVTGCGGTVGQARTERAPVPAPSVTGTSSCFYPRDVRDFRVLDRSNLVLYAPNDSNAYHVRLSPPSTELRFADTIAFHPAGDRICGYPGERLIVGPPTAVESLAIIAVARLSPESLQALRSAGEGGAGPAAPRPRPGPGADVEGSVAPPAAPNADTDGEK